MCFSFYCHSADQSLVLFYCFNFLNAVSNVILCLFVQLKKNYFGLVLLYCRVCKDAIQPRYRMLFFVCLFTYLKKRKLLWTFFYIVWYVVMSIFPAKIVLLATHEGCFQTNCYMCIEMDQQSRRLLSFVVLTVRNLLITFSSVVGSVCGYNLQYSSRQIFLKLQPQFF